MSEEFRSIPGYERYMINERGIVKRAAHSLRWLNRWGQLVWRHKKERIVKPRVSNVGYLRIYLSGDNAGSTSVHRLLMITFVPNPLNLPQINHKDGNKLNNRLDNLEWCDQFHNQRHAHDMGLNVPARGFYDTQSKPVKLLYSGSMIWVFGSIGEASRLTSLKRETIRKSCESKKYISGCSPKANGYKFEFYER